MLEFEFSTDINHKIYAYRKKSGYTQEEMADLLGLERNTYAKLEKYGNPSIDVIKKMSETFNVPMEGFFYSKDVNTNQIRKKTASGSERFEAGEQNLIYVQSQNVFDNSSIALSNEEAEIIRMLRALKDDERNELTLTIKEAYKEKRP